MLVDSHCHLDFDAYASELDAVVDRARAAGVGACVTICTKLSEFARVREIAERYPNLWCSIGVHPHEAKDADVSAATLVEGARHPRVIGIGETGLDYYYLHSPKDVQIGCFREHIAASRESGLPLIVHTRDAEDDTISVLEAEMAKGSFTGLIHCFTGSAKLAKAALELGFLISASGIVTFKNSVSLREVFSQVPLDRLLVETDAPYLSPVPYRGKRNEPAYVAHTANVLASIKGIDVTELAEATTQNFFRLFDKAVHEQHA
jgi:TatD DNase family protein